MPTTKSTRPPTRSPGGTGDPTADHPPLDQVPAGLLLALYCAIFLVIGIVLMKKRDITA